MKTTFFVAAVCVLSLVALVAADGKATWKSCAGANPDATVTNIKFGPIKKGQNITMTGSAVLHKKITAGTWKLSLDAGITLNYNGDICKDKAIKFPLGSGHAWITGLKCPASPGDITLSQVIEVGRLAPSSSTATLNATDSAGNQILCTQVNLQF